MFNVLVESLLDLLTCEQFPLSKVVSFEDQQHCSRFSQKACGQIPNFKSVIQLAPMSITPATHPVAIRRKDLRIQNWILLYWSVCMQLRYYFYKIALQYWGIDISIYLCRLVKHTPILTMRRGHPKIEHEEHYSLRLKQNQISTATDTFMKSHTEYCIFLIIYRWRIRSLAISRCQSIV